MREPDVKDPRAEPPSQLETQRLHLIWSLVKFQGKLIADGLRDLLLSPVSIVAVLVGLLTGGTRPDRHFDALMRWGRRSDVWINLFGAYRRGQTSDRMVRGVEQRIFEEYGKGGWFTRAGKGVNRALDTVNDGAAPKRKRADDSTDAS